VSYLEKISKSGSDLGKKGEEIALKILKNKGYSIICKNFRGRYGEIDIIAKDGDTLVFIEVKARRTLKYGEPEEAVDLRKIDKIKKLIDYFLLVNPVSHKEQRIEVISLKFDNAKLKSYKVINAT